MKRYEVWCGDEYCGIFWEDEIRWMLESNEPITIIGLDD